MSNIYLFMHFKAYQDKCTKTFLMLIPKFSQILYILKEFLKSTKFTSLFHQILTIPIKFRGLFLSLTYIICNSKWFTLNNIIELLYHCPSITFFSFFSVLAFATKLLIVNQRWPMSSRMHPFRCLSSHIALRNHNT